VDELKYRQTGNRNSKLRTRNPELGTLNPELLTQNSEPTSSELLTLKIRYKEPAGGVSKKIEFPLVDEGRTFAQASGDFKFASAVAAFGMILRESAYKGTATLGDVAQWAEAGESPDPGGYRAEFLSLVREAKTLM